MTDYVVCAIAVVWLIVWLSVYYFDFDGSVSRPSFSIKLFRRDYMADILQYSVTADAPFDADVVERVLEISVNGGEVERRVFAADVVDFGFVEVPQGQTVRLALYDVDDAGNASEPATTTFEARDTLPPAQPGAFVVTLVGERSEPDAVVPDADLPAVDPTVDELDVSSES